MALFQILLICSPLTGIPVLTKNTQEARKEVNCNMLSRPFSFLNNWAAKEKWLVLLTIRISTLGSDPLVRTLYEFDEQKENPNLGVKPMSRSLWKYRRRITVEHLANSFQQEALSADEDQYKVLGAFLKQVKKSLLTQHKCSRCFIYRVPFACLLAECPAAPEVSSLSRAIFE